MTSTWYTPAAFPFCAYIHDGKAQKADELRVQITRLAAEKDRLETRVRNGERDVNQAEQIRKRNTELCQEREKLGWRIEQMELEMTGLRAALSRHVSQANYAPKW